MAETVETSCIRLELSDGGHVYLRSIWETTNFSIVVLDGVRAWSRTVSAKEVVNIATFWKIDVGEFMKSARSHLSCQRSTSSYSISPYKDADVVQLSFTIDDLLKGELVNFDLHLERISGVGAVVCGMLNHLLDTKDKLKEQLTEVENQYQKTLQQLAASEPEPSITLSLARPSANPRRQSSSFMEPRLLDFTKFNRSEDRDAPHPGCSLTPTRAHGQLHHDTPKIPTRLPPPSFDLQDHGTKQLPNSNVEMEKEPVSYFNTLPRSRAVNGGRMGFRNNDLTVRTREAYVGFEVPLSPNIMRVLNSLSGAGTMQRNGIDCGRGVQNLHDCRDEGEVTMGGGRDERGVKITEMRSPARREEQSQRSCMLETNSGSIDLSSMTNSTNGRRDLFESKVHEGEGSRATTTSLRHKFTVPEGQPKLNTDIAADFTRPMKYTCTLEEDMAYKKSETMNWNAFSEMKKLQESHNCNDVNGVVLEKGSSNAGEPERSQVQGVNKFPEGEAKEGSDEEPTSKVTTEDVYLGRSNSDSALRAKAGLPEKPWGQWLNEAKSTEERHEKYQEQPKLADTEPRGSLRHQFPVETGKQSTGKVSLESLWYEDVIDTTVTPSTTKSDKKSLVTDASEYAHPKSTYSHPPVVGHQRRKRTIEDREDDSRGKTLRSVKLEIEDSDLEGTEGTNGSRGGTERSSRKFNTNVKQEVVELDDFLEEIQAGGNYKNRETIQKLPDEPSSGRTVADLLKKKPVQGSGGKGSKGKIQGQLLARGAPRRDYNPPEKRQRRKLRDDRSPSGEENVVDPHETNVPDPDYYNFDKDRTEDLVQPGQIWAVYDEKDGFPRVWARIDKVFRQPKFEVLISWLKPYKPSEDSEQWTQSSGYTTSCGKFEFGDHYTLTSINMFSHKMEVDGVARNVVKIYPKKGEVWTLYINTEKLKSASAASKGGPRRPHFRVVEVLEDVEAEKGPEIQVLSKVKGFRTVWTAGYQPGTLFINYLVLFSHRVPAYRLQGHELVPALKGSWDVDPAGLPLHDTQGDI